MKKQLKGLWPVVSRALFGFFRSLVLRSTIVETVDEANALLAKGWRLNNLNTRNSRWGGDPSRIRFMLVRLSCVGIHMPKRVNQNLLERPIAFGRWSPDAGADNMPTVIKKHLGDGSCAVSVGFNFFNYAKGGAVHNDVLGGCDGDSSNSLPNVKRVHPYQRGRASITEFEL
jgi:urocanate hydratase